MAVKRLFWWWSALILAASAAAQDVPYTVAAQPWAERLLGNHRARVRAREKADAVWVRIPWRRHDANPQQKAVVVRDANGAPVRNAVAFNVSPDAGDVVFEARQAGDYHVYYMPLAEVPPNREDWFMKKAKYLPPQATAERGWLERNGVAGDQIAAGRWRRLPRADVVEFQSRTAFDSFYPMEVIATAEEMAHLRKNHPSPYLLFAEDREHPIRMLDALPARWVASGPKMALKAAAYRGEYYVFQIGVYAQKEFAPTKAPIEVEFGNLRGPGASSIPAKAFECINTRAVDTQGRETRREFSVAPGRVGALWCGVQVPLSATPGRYQGNVSLRPQGHSAMTVSLDLDVNLLWAMRSQEFDEGMFLRAGGVDQPEGLARIRWLNSTVGLEEKITTPYTPLKVNGRTVACLGREVRFGPDGFPDSVQAGGIEVLSGPVGLRVYQGGSPAAWKGSGRAVSASPAKVVLESGSVAGSLSLGVKTTMEYDGGIGFDVRLRSEADADFSDIALEVPFRASAVPYIAGMGLDGGNRPRQWQWKWTEQKQRWIDTNSNLEYFIWLGGVKAGLYCRLTSPLEDWKNGEAGGVSVSETNGQVLFRAMSGPRRVRAGQELSFSFRLLPTPVKPLEASRFKTRYYHSYGLPADIRADTATVVNIHHDTPPNMPVNYPFLNLDVLRPYVREAHTQGLKVKIYYTVRELTTRLPELWAFRSLGNEIYSIVGTQAHGTTYLDSWLQEHLVSEYTPAWIMPSLLNGEVDAALRTHRDSRLNNFYLASLQWLVENVEIDGLYLDEISVPRHVFQRVRKVLETRPGAMIDLHGNRNWWSCNSPIGYYMEHLPYVDRLWFGEGFGPDGPPDFYLVEMSGIPFGVPNDLLSRPNLWRGMVFGMTSRAGQREPSPVAIWKLWDEFGIDASEMLGWWDADCPVKTDHKDVLATVYRKRGKSLVSIASWAPEAVSVKLSVNWKALGLDPAKVRLKAPAIAQFQEGASFGPGDSIPVEPKRGWIFLMESQ
jgi:hypothetical protein